VNPAGLMFIVTVPRSNRFLFDGLARCASDRASNFALVSGCGQLVTMQPPLPGSTFSVQVMSRQKPRSPRLK
jgi:hypothetical protein